MKALTIILLSSLLANIAFAGDLNLVCESVDGEYFYTAGIQGKKAQVSFTDKDFYGDDYDFNVSVLLRAGKYVYTITKDIVVNEHNYPKERYQVITNKMEQEFLVSDKIACVIRD